MNVPITVKSIPGFIVTGDNSLVNVNNITGINVYKRKDEEVFDVICYVGEHNAYRVSKEDEPFKNKEDAIEYINELALTIESLGYKVIDLRWY